MKWNSVFAIFLVFPYYSSATLIEWISCPYDYHLHGNSCYRMYGRARGYWHAQTVCATTSGGHLVTISDHEEQLQVQALCERTDPDFKKYIGLNTLQIYNNQTPTQYRWIDGGSLPSYTNWMGSQPNPVINNCVSIHKDNNWSWSRTADCSGRKDFICEVPASHKIPDPAPTCPAGFHSRFQGSCYLYVGGARSWLGAEQWCQNVGASLVTIGSPAENVFVENIALYYGDLLNSWIGLSNMVNGTMAWSDQSAFYNWQMGEPNNMLNACAVMNTNQGLAKWFDFPCSQSYPFICETKEYSVSRQKNCISHNNSTLLQTFFDSDEETCINATHLGTEQILTSQFNVDPSCVDKATLRVRFLVDVKDLNTCKNLRLYHSQKHQCDQGKSYSWLKCRVEADYALISNQCLVQCYCYDSAECSFMLQHGSPNTNQGKICRVSII